MSPGAAETAVGEGDQDADGEHERVALGFGGGDFDECADAGIRSLNEIAICGEEGGGGQRKGGSGRGMGGRTQGPHRGCGGQRGGI